MKKKKNAKGIGGIKMFNENPTAQITALFLTLLFVFLTACLIVNHVTWYNETDVIKCIKACGDLLYSGADNKLVSLPLREQCAERCMNLEDAKAPRVYKAECVYRVVNSNWYNPYYSESLY
jgi:hypothetical protein